MLEGLRSKAFAIPHLSLPTESHAAPAFRQAAEVDPARCASRD